MVKYINLSVDLFNFVKKNQPLKNKNIIEEFVSENCSKATVNRRLKTMVKDGYFIHKKPHDPYTINESKHPNKDKQKEIKSKLNYLLTLSYKRQEYQEQINNFQEEFRALIYENLKEEIKIAGKKPYFSDLMNEYIHNLIDSLLINGILLNPDLWYSFKNPEDFKFEIKLEIDLSKSPNTIKNLKKKYKEAIDLKTYPGIFTHYPLFDIFDPDESVGPHIDRPLPIFPWKDYIGDRTLKELRDKAMGEQSDRNEKLEKILENLDELGNIFMALIKKEKKFLQKNPQKFKILENSINVLWDSMFASYVRTLEKDFGICWTGDLIEILPIMTIKKLIQSHIQDINVMKKHPNQSLEESFKQMPKEILSTIVKTISSGKVDIKDSVSEIYPLYVQKLKSLKEALSKYEKK